MTTKKDLILAAQKFAADNIDVTDPHELGKRRHEAFESFGIDGKWYEDFRAETEASRQRYQGLAGFPLKVAKVAAAIIGLIVLAGFAFFKGSHEIFSHGFGMLPLMGMGWPTTGASGNGNAATGQYIASGTGTTLLWGTNNFTNITGFLTVTRIRQSTKVAFDEDLPNGDGVTAGNVIGIDGLDCELDVRDDTQQNTSALIVGQKVQLQDGGGLMPGGTRSQVYYFILKGHDWETAPKTAAGRTLRGTAYLLMQ